MKQTLLWLSANDCYADKAALCTRGYCSRSIFLQLQ